MLAIEAAMKEDIVAELAAAAQSHREGGSFPD